MESTQQQHDRHENTDNMQQSDHDTLIRVHERLVSMDDKLNFEQRTQNKLHEKLEIRMSAIEQWRVGINQEMKTFIRGATRNTAIVTGVITAILTTILSAIFLKMFNL